MSDDEQPHAQRPFRLELVRQHRSTDARPALATARSGAPACGTLKLIGSIATAYDRLTPDAARALRRVFAGSTLHEAHQAAELILMSTPLRDLTLVLTRLMAMSAESEQDVQCPLPASPDDAAS